MTQKSASVITEHQGATGMKMNIKLTRETLQPTTSPKITQKQP